MFLILYSISENEHVRETHSYDLQNQVKLFQKLFIYKIMVLYRFWRTENSLLTGQQSGLPIQRRFSRKRESMVKTRTRREIKWISTVTVIQETRVGKATTFWALDWSSSRKTHFLHSFLLTKTMKKFRKICRFSEQTTEMTTEMWQLFFWQ